MKNRAAFLKLLADCRAGKIDLIITKSVSRFGRNTVDCLNCVRELQELGVDVLFEKESIHTNRGDGELFLTLMSAVAQAESMAQSENVKWGIRHCYKQGEIQSIPYGKFLGYDKNENGELVINEVQAAIVHRIFREFLDGYSYTAIAAHLTAECIETVCHCPTWAFSNLKKILTNEKYIGDTLCQKTYNADYITKKRIKNNGELPQYYHRDTHPAIIDRTTWDCMQLEIDRQERYATDHRCHRYHNYNEKQLLLSRIICVECGCTYILRKSERTKDHGLNYWHCKAYRAGRYAPADEACGNASRIPYDIPEKALVAAWNALCNHFSHYVEEWKHRQNGGNVLVQYRARQLTKLVNEYGNLVSMPYELILKTLDHIQISPDESISVIFLTGTKVPLKVTDI